MVKYATALRLGTADTEDILRRFNRTNVQHPVYRALGELGKAVKTIFLCRYLHSMELRREIHEGLNVIESWNSANDFIFFGKGGEIASNRADDQEISMPSLHLVQLSLVYVNTLMNPASSCRTRLANSPHPRRFARPYPARLQPRQPVRQLPARPQISSSYRPTPFWPQVGRNTDAAQLRPADGLSRLPLVTAMLGLPLLPSTWLSRFGAKGC